MPNAVQYSVVAFAALAAAGCALLPGARDAASPSVAATPRDENIVPAAFSPSPPPPGARVMIGRPAAIIPCETGARIDDLCRREAEAHFREGDETEN